jgi:hypothetical protein
MPHNQETPNHVLHALLTLFTAGLYLPVWILIAMGKAPQPVCVKCGLRAGPQRPPKSTALGKRDMLVMLAVVGGAVVLAVAGALYMQWRWQ